MGGESCCSFVTVLQQHKTASHAPAEAKQQQQQQQQQQQGDPSAPVPAASNEALEQLVAASGKLSLLDRMMDQLVAGGHR
jgi:hypothetical protein